ncbi:cytochrome P450 9e2-like [Leptopilina heterotoma]|uniref:cytochrome P450 9e2-like n=1 Tax=Leptopilina heterotoma TaxID=63436 RepID=UPI001CA86F36|nr:cytochrome P450 9e2-like [Leptopilina heterotoma]
MTTTMLLLLIFIVIISVLFFIRFQNYWTRKGLIPHVQPVPFFGNTLPVLFRRTHTISEYICETYNLFPTARYVGGMQFHTPIIILRDPDLIRDMCIKYFDYLPDHMGLFPENTDPLFGKNLFVLRGDKWREMRNALSPSFTGSKMKFIFKLIYECSTNFVQYFLDNPEVTNSVNVKDCFSRYTIDVIATSAFGITVNSVKDRDNEFHRHGVEAADFSGIGRGLKIMLARYCTTFMKFIGEPILSRSTTRFFKTIIQQTVKKRKELNINRPDMINFIIEACQNEDGKELSNDDIVGHAFMFLLAGFATSATVMGFLAHELAVNPKIQEKQRNEVDQFTKENDEITYDTLSKMKYLDMVISETLRKYPPNAMMDRLCAKKFTLPKSTPDSEEYTIEPNSLIWLPIYALHHDPKYFPDPEKFSPERFSDENKDNINPYTYIPFGVGPQKCIGNRFALMEIKILFVHLLKNFILEREERTRHPIKFEKGFLVIAKGELWIKFTRRED